MFSAIFVKFGQKLEVEKFTDFLDIVTENSIQSFEHWILCIEYFESKPIK